MSSRQSFIHQQPPHCLFLIALTALFVLCFSTLSHATDSPPLAGHTLGITVPSDKAITPPDVFQHVARVHAELELLRAVMGRPKNTQPDIQVHRVAPREVFYQAITLFNKAGRINFEQTRRMNDALLPPEEEDLLPKHVFGVVDNALQLILNTKTALKIKASIQAPVYDASKTPTDVFRSIVQANRQLNLLLERRFAPKDVYQRVSVGIAYASRLLALFPEATRIPVAEPLQANIMPSDVFNRLAKIFALTRNIGEHSGIVMLEFEASDINNKHVPSDVYDIASLVVSELAHLHRQNHTLKPPRKMYDPGRKFPADVYQRVSILEQQLQTLLGFVEGNPQWLSLKANAL